MKNINKFSERVQNVFSEKDYGEFCALMKDTANENYEVVTQKEANDKIREVIFEVMGVDENSKKSEIRRALRSHKGDVFAILEETLDDLLESGWDNDPFFNEFVERKSLNLGDTNEFYTEQDIILTVSELSGNHHDLIRQKLGHGKSFQVKTSWYGVKVYTDLEMFMSGRIDWAKLVQKISEALAKKADDMIYTSFMGAGALLPNSSQFNKTGALTADKLGTLCEDVATATGEEVVIMGTRAALGKLTAIGDVDWISNSMKEDLHKTGRLGYWNGYRLVELKQVFAPNDTSVKLVDNNKLMVMPSGENRFIKMFNEGDTQISESTDGSKMDKTIEYECQTKMGVATLIQKYFGVYNITA